MDGDDNEMNPTEWGDESGLIVGFQPVMVISPTA